eukprot:s811_g3.t1
MESGAMRIYQRGMEIQEEYKDEVHHLQGLLRNTETRLQQTQHDSEYASSVANRLYSDGQEMQVNFENSIMEYRRQSDIVSHSHAHNEIMHQHGQLENQELMLERNALHEALDHYRKQAELYEMSMEQITKESRRKVHEANQAKAESDLRLKNTEHDVMKRVEAIKNAETEVIAKLRMESSINVSTRARMEQYESMYENERTLTEELKAELKIKDSQLRKAIQDDPSVSDRIAPNDVRVVTLENEVQAAHLEMSTLRAWNRQLDDAYNEEVNVAAQYAAASNQPRNSQIPQTGSNLPPGDGHRSIGDRPSGFNLPPGDGSTRSLRPGGDPPGDDPPDDDGPPGLPSIRSTTVPDDASSFTAATNIEPPRVSRREADKVYVSPWPKHQNLGVWTSDLIKGVCLAANDGDRAAWETWLQPAPQPDPDLDALNDSNGQRYQSIDAKLSIALSNVITQAGDVARHVATKLRLRTQANSRRGTFVMGREILAMILNHFRTPGQRETTFTMEHIVRAQYLGDSNIDVFYEKWVEMVSNMMPEDVPPDMWLRDALYKKIRNSHALMFDIKQYESWMENDPRKTYQHLLDCIERYIARIREDKHVAAREKYARDFAGAGKPGAPAPATPNPKADAKAKPKAKAKEKAAAAPKAKAKVPVFKIASTQKKKKVSFNMNANEFCTYEKVDFVKCTKTSQTGSKAHGKMGKSTEQIKKDEHWAYSCRLAASRGKAMAIIMDEIGDYRDVDEVLVIIGPTLDIKIKMEMEDDDPVREVFVENYVQHVVGRYGKRGNIMCITVPVEERDKKFIMDSGSGHDLISIKKIDRMDLSTYDDEVVNFHTANGVTSSTKRSDIEFKAFDEPAQMHVLDDTPSVLSMGKRCLDLGYSFVWPSGKDPYMIDCNGNIIEMTVKDYIPYMNLDQEKKTGSKKKVERILEIISDDCSTSEGENMMVIDGESGDELEDLTDSVSDPKGLSSKKKRTSKKKKKSRHCHEAAVGSDAEDDEQMHHHAEDDIDDYAEFDDEDERGYSPSVGPDDEDVDHNIEIEEEREGDRNEDDEDIIDVDEEDGSVRLSKRGTLKNEARSKTHLLTHRYKNPYCEKYRVWALCDWSKQSLAYDAEKPIRKLRTPHYTERVELKEPLEFPCKIGYEKINVTIEGLKEKDRLEGNAEIIPPPIDDQDDDNDGDEDGDGDGRPPSKKIPQKGIEGEPSLDDIEKEMFPGEEPVRPGPPGIDKSAHPDLKIPEGGPEHYSMGKAGDGIVYLNDDGEWVKINSRGHPYRIDERGFRRISGTPRPSRYTPTEWQKMAPDVRKGIAKAERKAKRESRRVKIERKPRRRRRQRKKRRDLQDPERRGMTIQRVWPSHKITYVMEKCFSMAESTLLPPGVVHRSCLIPPTLTFLPTMISLWSGMSGLKWRTEEDQRLLGMMRMLMTSHKGR